MDGAALSYSMLWPDGTAGNNGLPGHGPNPPSQRFANNTCAAGCHQTVELEGVVCFAEKQKAANPNNASGNERLGS
jgi:hypothetical protein